MRRPFTLAAAPRHSSQRPPARPNILLIQADDLGYGDLSVYGQGRFETPALDRLAREGIRFTQYYAGSTVCAPSRAALMTGLHTGHGWIRGNGEIPLRTEDVTIAELLRKSGYRTAVIGKWGLGTPGTTGEPGKKGFEHSFGFLDHRHAHRQYTDHLWRNGQKVETDLDRDYVNDLFTKEATEFIARDDKRPFFIYMNYTVPHAELRVPEDMVAPFRDRFPEKPFVNEKADAKPTGAQFDAASLGYRSQPTPHAAFAAMITRMDRDIGSLAELLKTRGIDRQTLVMFVSDNGPHQEGGGDPVFFKSSGGLRGIKRDLYEGGIRVPMIARWTGTIPAGRVSDHVWAHWDMLPTLTQLAGVDVGHARRARRPVDGARAARRAAADARFHVLGVSRTRLSAGRADGKLEGRPPEEGRAAGTLRSRHRSRRTTRRRRRESGSGAEDHHVPRVSANRIGALADQVASIEPARCERRAST